ncbi:MAG: sigma factor G inhibitor Gin [Tissierellaceae bacterium]
MYCSICGEDKSAISVFGQSICMECLDEISNITVGDQAYEYYKNTIRIILGYYISEKQQLNPVN